MSKPKPIRHKSIKLVRKDRLKSFIDRRLIKALSHPVREHILAVLNERVASTVEIGDEIELDVPVFNKQVQLLEELGFVEKIGKRSGRGGEQFLRATATALFGDEVWEGFPASVKTDIDFSFLRGFVDEALKAIVWGTFHARADKHTSWSPSLLDQRGWDETMRILSIALFRLVAIRQAASMRILKSGEPGIPTTIAMFGFETSPDYVRPARSPFILS
jgi:DNA-binding transcriptional ArsR family regulator